MFYDQSIKELKSLVPVLENHLVSYHHGQSDYTGNDKVCHDVCGGFQAELMGVTHSLTHY